MGICFLGFWPFDCSVDWAATGSMISGIALAFAAFIAHREYRRWRRKRSEDLAFEANKYVYEAISHIEYAMSFENQFARKTARYSQEQIAKKNLPENYSDQVSNISNYREYMLSKSAVWAQIKSFRDRCKIYNLPKSAAPLEKVLQAKEYLDRAAMGILNYYDRQPIGVRDEAYPYDSHQYQLGLLFFGGQLFQDRVLPDGYKKYEEDFHRVFRLLREAESEATNSLN